MEHESLAEQQNIMVKIHWSNGPKKSAFKIGDILKQCTCALNAEETCSYDDLRKIQWAINKHKQAVNQTLFCLA